MLEFDFEDKKINLLKNNGISVGLRKNHTAVIYKNSMVVFGGTGEGGFMCNDMLAYNFDDSEWTKVKFAGV